MSENLALTEISTRVIQDLNNNFSDVEDTVNEKADLQGDSAQVFQVANATMSTHAINKGQLDSSTTAININMSLKADKTYVDTNLALKANSADLDAALAAKANLNGNSSQAFNVADAAISTQAVNKGQLDNVTASMKTLFKYNYANRINKAASTTYTAESNGLLYWNFANANANAVIILDGSTYFVHYTTQGQTFGFFYNIAKGQTYYVGGAANNGGLYFIPQVNL